MSMLLEILQMTKILRTSGAYTISSGSGLTTFESVIKLNPQTKTQLNARSDLADGMIAMASDGDSTQDRPVYYSGGVWRYFSNDIEI